MRIVLALCACLGVLTACGGDESSGEGSSEWGELSVPEVRVTFQEAITVDEFNVFMSEDSELASVAQGVTLVQFGRLENDHNGEVVWGEGLTTQGEPAGAVRICDAQGCSSATQAIQGGKLIWQTALGAETTMRSIGQPSLLRDLEGHDLANHTTMVPTGSQGLGITMAQDDVPPIDFSTRRFVALNTFGDLLDVNLDEVTDAVRAIGGFDEVEELQYARESTVREAFRGLDNLDAVVWLSQAVRETRKAGANPEYRTVGLTANRAVYGETLFSRQDIEEIWFNTVANGPGILFLAASNSYSDGHPEQPEKSSLWRKMEDVDRILIGIKGHADTNAIVRSAAVFFDVFLRGEKSLGTAIKEANAWLAPTNAQLFSNQDDLSQTALRSYDIVWEDAPLKNPTARLTVPITGTPQCGEGDGPKSPKEEDFATAWADITFDGATFSGDRKIDTQSLQVDTHIRGVLTGFEVGDAVYIETYGDMDKTQFQNFHAFGIGRIEKAAFNDEGEYVIEFTGPAHVAEFNDADGLNCVLVSPTLATTTGVIATLVLAP